MLKLDIAHGFDFVSRGILFVVIHKLGFGKKFCAWIAILLSTASTKVLLNGEPGPLFSTDRA
jgi:hypothetical protein